MTKYRNIKDKLGIGCNKLISPKPDSNYENRCSTGYQMCNDCESKSIMFDRYIELCEHKVLRDLLYKLFDCGILNVNEYNSELEILQNKYIKQ